MTDSITPFAASTTKLAAAIQGSAWASSTVRLAEVIGPSVWTGAAEQLAQSISTPAWRGFATQLAESMKSPLWEESATRLAELTSTSAWADIVASLTAVVEDDSLLESFVAAADIQPALAETADLRAEGEAPVSPAQWIKRGLLYAAAIYIVAAIALHLSNFLTTPNPVFDPHLFLVDEFIAMGLALAFYCAFWKD